jgi:major membrane immunogen (membrane-anchored lipoprotein)
MFKILGEIEFIETIAKGSSIRELSRLKKKYGDGKWRKLKGIADIELRDGRIVRAEIHWYEAHGKGKKEFKIKRIIE